MPIDFGDLAGAKRLGKRREPLEEVAQFSIHCEPISDVAELRKIYAVPILLVISWKDVFNRCLKTSAKRLKR